MISSAAITGGFPTTVIPVVSAIAPVNASSETQSTSAGGSLAQDAAQNGGASTANENLKPGSQKADRERSAPQQNNGLAEAEIKLVRELSARDREVRAHEQAHANVGGRYAGSPTYSFQKGPDGRQYAVGGEVSIDVSPIPGDPQATIEKAHIVRRAALAPAQPSAQDRAVAAEATAIQQQASAELLAQIAEARSPQGGADPGSERGGENEGQSGGQIGSQIGSQIASQSSERSSTEGMTYYRPIDVRA